MIPFRRQRLATSVVNRILDIYEGLQPPTQPGMPAVPTPLPEGQLIDQKLNQPVAPSTADSQTADAIALKQGGLL